MLTPSYVSLETSETILEKYRVIATWGWPKRPDIYFWYIYEGLIWYIDSITISVITQRSYWYRGPNHTT
ncbi:uncharacterized protein H6S33_008522 [Morchella sextelata]|uniref:uncharacterized protein n=1 Tax=Morchella sextelata TaxID=1174677 RepID=UPI001D04F89A|nr:uncharacterized protein H6S33_008522 [Morchella sextelata]KAH0602872.1 hypothetical protein H6S33_008522 [Morchella sextelata]